MRAQKQAVKFGKHRHKKPESQWGKMKNSGSKILQFSMVSSGSFNLRDRSASAGVFIGAFFAPKFRRVHPSIQVEISNKVHSSQSGK